MSPILLVVHPERPAAWELASTATRWWQRQGRDLIEVREAEPGSSLAGRDDIEFAVSLGGDGTMLRTVELVLAARVPVLGVNLGRMGYLTAVEPAGMERAFEMMLAGDYLVEELGDGGVDLGTREVVDLQTLQCGWTDLRGYRRDATTASRGP